MCFDSSRDFTEICVHESLSYEQKNMSFLIGKLTNKLGEMGFPVMPLKGPSQVFVLVP